LQATKIFAALTLVFSSWLKIVDYTAQYLWEYAASLACYKIRLKFAEMPEWKSL
jgi:hypothetical protein